MGVFAVAAGVRKAPIAANAGDDACGEAFFHQHGPLFDMRLQEGRDPGDVKMRRAFAHPVRIAAAFRHVLRERDAVVHPARILQRAVRKHAERRAAADIGDAEPAAFLGPHAHDGNVLRRRVAERLERADRRQAGDDAGGAVEIAALRHRIQVRADHLDRLRAIPAGPGHVGVGGGVLRDLQAQPASDLRHQGVRRLLAFAVARARDAAHVDARRAKTVEHLRGEIGLRLDGGDEFGRHARRSFKMGSSQPAAAITAASSPRRPTSWLPTGRPFGPTRPGTVMQGAPTKVQMRLNSGAPV